MFQRILLPSRCIRSSKGLFDIFRLRMWINLHAASHFGSVVEAFVYMEGAEDKVATLGFYACDPQWLHEYTTKLKLKPTDVRRAQKRFPGAQHLAPGVQKRRAVHLCNRCRAQRLVIKAREEGFERLAEEHIALKWRESGLTCSFVGQASTSNCSSPWHSAMGIV